MGTFTAWRLPDLRINTAVIRLDADKIVDLKSMNLFRASSRFRQAYWLPRSGPLATLSLARSRSSSRSPRRKITSYHPVNNSVDYEAAILRAEPAILKLSRVTWWQSSGKKPSAGGNWTEKP